MKVGLFTCKTRGMGIRILSQTSNFEFEYSRTITKPLVDHINKQQEILNLCPDDMKAEKSAIKAENQIRAK